MTTRSKRAAPQGERGALVARAKTAYPDAFRRVRAACCTDSPIDVELHAARVVLKPHERKP